MSENNAENLPVPIDLDAHRARRDDDSRTGGELAGQMVPLSPDEVESMDTAYEIAIDDADDDPTTGKVIVPVPVDTPGLPVAVADGRRLPIIPTHLRPENLKTTTTRALARAGH